jgi:hypothetical protein
MLLKLLLPPLVCATLAFSQSNNFPAREVFYYNIEWRLFSAGKARVELNTTPQPRPGLQVKLHVESAGIVSKLFKVDDDYAASLSSAFCAQSLQMTTQEGSRLRETKITFDGERKKASFLERDLVKNSVLTSAEIDIPTCVSDIIGALYKMRTLNLDLGQAGQIAVSDGRKSAMARVDTLVRMRFSGLKPARRMMARASSRFFCTSGP